MNLDEQKQKLLLEKETIEKDLNGLGRELNGSGDWVVRLDGMGEVNADPLDEANETEELEADVAVLEVLEKRYEQVKKALKVIEDGTYGVCEESGCKIPEERLEANPSATTCVEHTE